MNKNRFHLASCFPYLLLLALPAVAQAQFDFITNNGAITIKSYTGPGGAVTIPSSTNGLPVTRIADGAFYERTNLTSVAIPNSVTNIGGAVFVSCTSLVGLVIPDSIHAIPDFIFAGCTGLTNVTIPTNITSIGTEAFESCTSMTSVAIPNSVTNIKSEAFYSCTGLTNITLPNSLTTIAAETFDLCTGLTTATVPKSVTNVQWKAFLGCTNLTKVYFTGDAPAVSQGAFQDVFLFDNAAAIYYLPGTAGWTDPWQDRPTVLWVPQVRTSDQSFGVQANQFGFNIDWASGMTIVVEASTDLANPAWYPLRTNTLAGDSFYFSDPQWSSFSSRFYRVRWQ